MDIINKIRIATLRALSELYPSAAIKEVQITETKPEFEGDYTIVLFSFIKALKKSPEQLGGELGEFLVNRHPELFTSFNVIKGFLNLVVTDASWARFLEDQYANTAFGRKGNNGQRVMVEYSSPNTNKPLHMGHLRNNFLGWSVAEIHKINGYETVKTCIANDRGIHICKSMIAWQLFAGGATPATTGVKGDHFVGDFYVLFGEELKKQAMAIAKALHEGDDSMVDQGTREIIHKHLDKIKELETRLQKTEDPKQRSGIEEEIKEETSEIKGIAENAAPIMKDAKQMLVDWEAGKPAVIALWREMNSWVYTGFDKTYKRIGSDFDKVYYESDTYLLGKDLVEDGLEKGVFFKKEDGSVWIDLTADGLDEKIVRRKDGTAVYMTQDIGLAVEKYKEFKPDSSIYVVGDEQNYHFKVLKLICQKLGLPSADGIYHLSYGMVELPTGRMKTREGTVVDADDMLDEMIREAEKKTLEQGKTDGFTSEELADLYEMIGVGGLKFFLLRVDPKKRMLFNPEESIDLHGFTATFVQYTHARIKSVLRKELELQSASRAKQDPGDDNSPGSVRQDALLPLEKSLILELEKYPAVLEQAGLEMNPSVIAGYAFNVAKKFNSFYSAHSIASAETPAKKQLRLKIAQLTGIVIRSSMALLGIRVPERM